MNGAEAKMTDNLLEASALPLRTDSPAQPSWALALTEDELQITHNGLVAACVARHLPQSAVWKLVQDSLGDAVAPLRPSDWQVPDGAWVAALALGFLMGQAGACVAVAKRIRIADERSPTDSPIPDTDIATAAATVSQGAPVEASMDGATQERSVGRLVDTSVAQDFVRVLKALELAAAWHPANHEAVVRAVQQVRSHPLAKPERVEQQIDLRLTRGAEQQRWRAKVLELGRQYGPRAAQTLQAVKQAAKAVPYLNTFAQKLTKDLDRLEASIARRSVTTSLVTPPARSHRIGTLAPAARWTLAIDESGIVPATLDGRKTGILPRFVGLLVPVGTELPPLAAGWHAVEQSDPHAIDRVLQAVLDAPVGVFGLTLQALPTGGQFDAWACGVLEVVRWTLRQLALTGDTEVEVLVEQRGEHTSGTAWKAAVAALMRQLVQEDPRYRQVQVVIRLIDKGGSPLNPYVDALAYSWGSPTPASQARIAQSRLLGICFLRGSLASYDDAWQAVARDAWPGDAPWRALVADPDATVEGSLAWHLLERLRAMCQREPAAWSHMVNAVTLHLNSKAVRLGALGREVAELARCQPVDYALTPVMALAMLIAQLEHANHEGQVDKTLESRLESLSVQLLEEVPELVAQADLVRAVLATNRFDFAGASQRLARWVDADPVAPGLQHYGRIWSSYGQHAAFRGDWERAELCFERALGAFGRLSDPLTARQEHLHTATYRAIAGLDNPRLSGAARRDLVAACVSLEPEAIATLACSEAPQDAYCHHLLVRYLVTEGREAEKNAYRQIEHNWARGTSHPWQLIGWYRGLLLHEAGFKAKASRWVAEAVALALSANHGPTVQLIGGVLQKAGRKLGLNLAPHHCNWPNLQNALPMAAWPAIEAGPADSSVTAVQGWITQVLPFNFH